MTPNNQLAGKPLLPHQDHLLETFFAIPHVATLHADWSPGLGVHITAAHVVRRFLREVSTARVLVLGPKALQDSSLHTFLQLGIETSAVDRFAFRAMQDQANTSADIWAPGKAFLLSYEFARQADISQSLVDVPWDLLVTFEGHRVAGSTADLAKAIVAASPRLRVLAFTTGAALSASTQQFGREPKATVSVRIQDVLALDNAARRPPETTPQIEIVSVESTQDEMTLGAHVRAVVGSLTLTPSNLGERLGQEMAARAQSSQAALESGLRRLLNSMALAGPTASDWQDDVLELLGRPTPVLPLGIDSGRLRENVRACLDGIDALPEDSKSMRLRAIIAAAIADAGQRPSIFVMAEFRDTVWYLQSVLQDLGVAIHVVHGGMSYEDSARVSDAHRQVGGILIGTPAAAMKGIELPYVTWAILFDWPASLAQVQQIAAHLLGSGREQSLRATAFAQQPALGPPRTNLPSLTALLSS